MVAKIDSTIILVTVTESVALFCLRTGNIFEGGCLSQALKGVY